MVSFRVTLLCMVTLIGVLIQNSSSKSVDEEINDVESLTDLDQLEDIKELEVAGSKRDVNKDGDETLIQRAVNNTGLTKDEIEEVEKRGWRRYRRGRRRRRYRRRRYRRNRNRRRRYRRRRYRRRRSRRRNGQRGSRRKGSGRNGGGGGFGSHIGSAITGGLHAFHTGVDLAHQLSPGNNPDNTEQDMNEEEDTF